MHSCPECGQACYCDGEDHENPLGADDCIHYLTEGWDDSDEDEVYRDDPGTLGRGKDLR
jgi:hypothetical protein